MLVDRLRSLYSNSWELIFRRPRLGCGLALAGWLSFLGFSTLDSPGWQLLGLTCVAAAIMAYLPLRAYTHNLDHDRIEGRNYKYEYREMSTGTPLGEYDERLTKWALDKTRWALGGVLVSSLGYGMLATQFNLWAPQTPTQWNSIILAAILLIYGLPTVFMALVYRRDYDMEWPAWEDVD